MDDVDLATIELLCRLQLLARRLGCRIVVDHSNDALRDAITAAGLADALMTEHPTKPIS